MTPRSSIVGALLLAHAMVVQAQSGPAAADTAGAAELPPADAQSFVSLLEFIGEFTTEDGEWVDPDLLLESETAGATRRPELGARDTDDGRRGTEQDENCGDAPCE